MKRDIAEKWIAELRSGKWEQGNYSLAINGKHCCLGVLCEIAVSENICVKESRTTDAVYDGEDVALPNSVLSWSGIKSRVGHYKENSYLVQDNDLGLPFSKIADIIEANIENL